MKLLKRIIRIIFLVLIICVGVVVYHGYSMYSNAISEEPLKEKIAEVKSIKNYTEVSEMPQIYLKAVVAVEDHRFYNHSGIDLVSIARAIIADVKAGKFVEGGSTITQQLAKNMYFTQEKKITRKIAEVFMAFELESNLNKDEILELYLNTSYFGAGCYTVHDASHTYFDKDPIDMDEYESTMLAGIPNAPSVYAPTVNPELAKERQKHVLQKMISNNVITKEDADKMIQ